VTVALSDIAPEAVDKLKKKNGDASKLTINEIDAILLRYFAIVAPKGNKDVHVKAYLDAIAANPTALDAAEQPTNLRTSTDDEELESPHNSETEEDEEEEEEEEEEAAAAVIHFPPAASEEEDDVCMLCRQTTLNRRGKPLGDVLLCESCDGEVRLRCSSLGAMPLDEEPYFCERCNKRQQQQQQQ
jgi:hypothetical protein